jgi:predicted ATPase with chaperone activity
MPCTYLPGITTQYQKFILGPLLDRIDNYIEVLMRNMQSSATIADSGDSECIQPANLAETLQYCTGIMEGQY